MTNATTTAPAVCPFDALLAFAQQRPGIEPGNYASLRDYRAESRQVTQDLHDVRALVGMARYHIPADVLTDSRPHRRLTWDAARGCWDYTTGQYFAVEYRKAAARLLAESIGRHWINAAAGRTWPEAREWARKLFGRRIASRYF
jgi:hypothetical protein